MAKEQTGDTAALFGRRHAGVQALRAAAKEKYKAGLIDLGQYTLFRLATRFFAGRTADYLDETAEGVIEAESETSGQVQKALRDWTAEDWAMLIERIFAAAAQYLPQLFGACPTGQ